MPFFNEGRDGRMHGYQYATLSLDSQWTNCGGRYAVAKSKRPVQVGCCGQRALGRVLGLVLALVGVLVTDGRVGTGLEVARSDDMMSVFVMTWTCSGVKDDTAASRVRLCLRGHTVLTPVMSHPSGHRMPWCAAHFAKQMQKREPRDSAREPRSIPTPFNYNVPIQSNAGPGRNDSWQGTVFIWQPHGRAQAFCDQPLMSLRQFKFMTAAEDASWAETAYRTKPKL